MNTNKTSALVSGEKECGAMTRRESSPFKMPINVAVEEPRARIISKESDRDIITRIRVPVAHDIANHGIVIVISRVAGAADDVEGVSVQVNWVLE